MLLFPAPDKKKGALLPIEVDHIEQRVKVISDKFTAYASRIGHSHLEELGFQHYFINHSIVYVDPVRNFIYTISIERVWRSLRASISHVRRIISHEKVEIFLDTFQFSSFFSKESLYDVLL